MTIDCLSSPIRRDLAELFEADFDDHGSKYFVLLVSGRRKIGLIANQKSEVTRIPRTVS